MMLILALAFIGYTTAIPFGSQLSTGTPLPTVAFPEDCDGFGPQFADDCADFGGKTLFALPFSSSRANVWVNCMDGNPENMICRRCPSTHPNQELIYSAECDACIYREDEFKPCYTETSLVPAEIVDLTTCNQKVDGFCDDKISDGNYPLSDSIDEVYQFYVACVHGKPSCMPCVAGLYYDKTCDSCNYKKDVLYNLQNQPDHTG